MFVRDVGLQVFVELLGFSDDILHTPAQTMTDVLFILFQVS